MALWCRPLRISWGKKSKIPIYPKHRQLWSSEYLEDHPSAPEAITESSYHRSAGAASATSSPNNFTAMWGDPSKVVGILRAEWTMGPEETFHKDKWFGRQLLLYYQVQKMADQFQSLKEFGLSESQSKSLDEYPYSSFCRRLGLLDLPLSETIEQLDPQPGNQELFEAYVGIKQRHLANQGCEYQALKQWLSDLESYTHPYSGSIGKEVLFENIPSPMERHIEHPIAESMSDSTSVPVHSSFHPSISKSSHQPSLSAPCVPAPSSPPPPPLANTSLNPTGLPIPTFSATNRRRKKLQQLSTFTSRLIQHGIDSNIDVRYDPPYLDEGFPPRFHCKVYVGNSTAEGLGTTKKEAKHKASEAALTYVPKQLCNEFTQDLLGEREIVI